MTTGLHVYTSTCYMCAYFGVKICAHVTCRHKTVLSKTRHMLFGGAKTQTGQTALKKEVILSKLDFKFSAHSDKHQSDDLSC